MLWSSTWWGMQRGRREAALGGDEVGLQDQPGERSTVLAGSGNKITHRQRESERERERERERKSESQPRGRPSQLRGKCNHIVVIQFEPNRRGRFCIQQACKVKQVANLSEAVSAPAPPSA